jgi:hypothetical protein
MPGVYLFDVDETLWCSNGPVTRPMLEDLRKQGHIVGLCGNLHCFMERVTDWYNVISCTTNFDTLVTLGFLVPKQYWLKSFLISCRNADFYTMVGNELGRVNSLGFKCQSADGEETRAAGSPWRFIVEDDFAGGVR